MVFVQDLLMLIGENRVIASYLSSEYLKVPSKIISCNFLTTQLLVNFWLKDDKNERWGC